MYHCNVLGNPIYINFLMRGGWVGGIDPSMVANPVTHDICKLRYLGEV